MTHVFVPAILALFFFYTSALAQTADATKDLETQMRALIVELDARWNARDAEPFSRMFTVDTDFRLYERRHERSREEIRRRYAQNWPQVPPGIRHKSSVDTVRPLAPGVVLVDGEVLVGEPGAPESETRRYHYATVVVLRDGEWLFDVFRVTQRPTTPR